MASDAPTPALPAALAMLTSPTAIAAMIALLLSRRGRVNATAFAGGWFAAVGAAVVVAALVRPTLPDGGAGSGVMSLVLGSGARVRRGRARRCGAARALRRQGRRPRCAAAASASCRVVTPSLR